MPDHDDVADGVAPAPGADQPEARAEAPGEPPAAPPAGPPAAPPAGPPAAPAVTAVELRGRAGEVEDAETEQDRHLAAPVGSTVVLTATTTPAKAAAAPATDATWMVEGSAPSGGATGMTDTGWTWTTQSFTKEQAGLYTVTIGGKSARLKVTAAGSPAPAPTQPDAVVETGVGEYDPKFTAGALGVTALLGVVLGLAWWSARDLVRELQVTTTAGVALKAFTAVGLLALALAALMALVAAFCGALEARARLKRPEEPVTQGDAEDDDVGGRAGTDVVPWTDAIKAALEKLVVMRATVALLAVSGAIVLTTVIASCQVATSAVTPGPSSSPTPTLEGGGSPTPSPTPEPGSTTPAPSETPSGG